MTFLLGGRVDGVQTPGCSHGKQTGQENNNDANYANYILIKAAKLFKVHKTIK